MEFPAICRDCGRAFPSGFVFENVRNISLAGNTSGPCPYCGGTGDVPDGVFDVLDDTVRILSAPDYTIERLQRLADRLNAAYDERESPDAVEAIVREEAPELAGQLKRLLVPTDAAGTWTMIGVFVALIIAVLGQRGAVTEEDVERITNDAIERVVKSAPKRPEEPRASPSPTAKKKQTRPKRPPKTHGKNKKRKPRRR